MVYLEKPALFKSEVSVVSCIFLWKGKTLLLLRGTDRRQGGKWGCPGGKVDGDEKKEVALKREIFEETGVVVDENDLTHFKDFYVDTLGSQFEYSLFSLEFEKKPDVEISEEHSTYKWVELHEVLAEKLVFDHAFCMKEFLRYYDSRNND